MVTTWCPVCDAEYEHRTLLEAEADSIRHGDPYYGEDGCPGELELVHTPE